MKRLASNIILGLFILVLVSLYGISKQPSFYSLMPLNNGSENVANDATPAPEEETEIRVFDRELALSNGDTLNVAIADNPLERIQGLSGLASLASDEGMLFVFDDSGKHGIWMKNMNFAIDILWLDDTGEVVHVVEQAPPAAEDLGLLVYQNEEPARYVLEIPAGEVAEREITIGSKVEVL
jgi:hypothetical protein